MFMDLNAVYTEQSIKTPLKKGLTLYNLNK